MAKLCEVKFGRPSIDIPENFIKVIKSYKNGKLTSSHAVEMSGLTRGTFYRKLKIIEENN